MEKILPEIQPVNQEITQELQQSSVYTRFKSWLLQNGCIFPNLDFPCAFGKFGYIGIRARNRIPCLKAFLFVPMNLIITPQKARESELSSLFSQFKILFDGAKTISYDYLLWVYLIYQKLKGEQSFYKPYFDTIQHLQILTDYTLTQLSQFQDDWISFQTQRLKQDARSYFKILRPFLEVNKQFFPTENLEEVFLWAFKLVNTRAFSIGEGMVIPLADNLNHGDIYVDTLTFSAQFLQIKSRAEQRVIIKDYKDFSGQCHISNAPMKIRTHLNRLQKYYRWYGDQEFNTTLGIWELEKLFTHFQSSSDQQEHDSLEQIEDSDQETESESQESESQEESSDDGEDFDLHLDVQGKFLIMRTGKYSSFAQGEQMLYCYGRMNNFKSLIDYNFALLPNRYDCFMLRLVRNKGPLRLVFPSDIPKQLKDYQKTLKIFHLKYSRLNTALLSHIRRKLFRDGELSEDLSMFQVEKLVVRQALKLINEASLGFKTEVFEDEMQLEGVRGHRELFALRYRISQKRIIEKQIEFLNRALDILDRCIEGVPLHIAHWEIRDIQNARLMYPLTNYLKRLDSLS